MSLLLLFRPRHGGSNLHDGISGDGSKPKEYPQYHIPGLGNKKPKLKVIEGDAKKPDPPPFHVERFDFEASERKIRNFEQKLREIQALLNQLQAIEGDLSDALKNEALRAQEEQEAIAALLELERQALLQFALDEEFLIILLAT